MIGDDLDQDAGSDAAWSHWAVGLMLVTLVFAFIVCVGDLTQEPLADFAPGARFPADPYTRPPACPERDWQVGEFVPLACVDGQWLAHPSRVRLQDRSLEGRRSMKIRHRDWIRVRNNAYQVIGMRWSGWRIRSIVKDRFDAPLVATPIDLASDTARDYRQMPWTYALIWLGFLMAPPLVGLAIGFSGWRNPSWRRKLMD